MNSHLIMKIVITMLPSDHFKQVNTEFLKDFSFLQEVADKEIAALPRDSCPVRIRNRCVMTSRPRGVKRRWRLSRIVFRHLADHNQMSGILRARWWTGIHWTMWPDQIMRNQKNSRPTFNTDLFWPFMEGRRGLGGVHVTYCIYS